MRRIFALAATAALSLTQAAQAADLSPTNGAAARTQASQAPVTIPVLVADNLVFMTGSINGSAPLSVALDTGGGHGVVDAVTARQLHLTLSGVTDRASGIGAAETLSEADNVTLAWGPGMQLKLPGQRISILPIGWVGKQTGKATDAFFGANIFQNFRVTVDYERHTAQFSSFDAPPPRGEAIPIDNAQEAPTVMAALRAEDGTVVHARFILDSGTTGALVLRRGFLSEHPALMQGHPWVDVPSTTAVGGAIPLRVIRMTELDLGSFQLRGPIAAVPDETRGVFAKSEIAGFIGADVLRRFTVTWDYAKHQMWLSPNAGLREPFETDGSGLRLAAGGADLHRITVDAVTPGSPAARAGVLAGDLLFTVNGASGLPLWRIQKMLAKPGSTVALTVQRDGQLHRLSVHLARRV